MIDMPNIIKDNPKFILEFAKYQENTLAMMQKRKKILDASSSDYLLADGIYHEIEDIEVLIKRTDARIKGAKKVAIDMVDNPTKVSPFKLYLIASLAQREHWYKTDVDTDSIGLEVKGYLHKIKNLIETNPPSPDDASWKKIRKEYPAMMHDIIKYVEKARNKTDVLLDIGLGEKTKEYWEQCRIFELYHTLTFKDDLDVFSEPIDPVTPLHPSDTFIKYDVDPSEFQEKKRNKFIFLEEMSEIRKEALLYTDLFNGLKELKKLPSKKPK